MQKHSRQRDAILQNLMSRRDHPTADAIYQSLRHDLPRISLGTVYRNLNLMAEMGMIRSISCEGGIRHYDYDTSDHCHYVCTCCGNVMDLPIPADKELNRLAQASGIGSIDCHSLIFYGTCSRCKEQASTGNREL